MHSPETATASLCLMFRFGVSLMEENGGPCLVYATQGSVELHGASPGVVDAIRRLATGATEEELVRTVTRSDGAAALPVLFYYLNVLAERKLLCQTIRSQGTDLSTVIPCRQQLSVQHTRFRTEAKYILSRFAFLRRTEEGLILESPLSDVRLVIHDKRAIILLHALAVPHRVAEFAHECADLPCDAVELFLDTLLSKKMIVESDKGTEQHLHSWSFHDLLMHARSRRGRYDGAYGATFPLMGAVDPLPAVKPAMSGDGIALFRPELEAVTRSDLPLTQVLEGRCSIREHGTNPVTLEQLGEFLYRVARVRSIQSDDEAPYQRSSRPYPSAGACYELEIYPIVTACMGLESGVYHYDPAGHQLHRISRQTHDVDLLMQEAAYASGQTMHPQILLVITARFGRVAWKYDAIAYALTLKNVGVLLQTMYLVATAMNLAGCALGGGNADRFADITGIDYYDESSVGEFMLGSRPEQSGGEIAS